VHGVRKVHDPILVFTADLSTLDTLTIHILEVTQFKAQILVQNREAGDKVEKLRFAFFEYSSQIPQNG
jgi:hypothetical protein